MDSVTCPRCGSAIVERQNRASGESFYGCTMYPSCRGTRPIDRGASVSRPEAQLASGGRARGVADYVELAIARRTGRQRLGRWQAMFLRLGLLVVWATVVYFAFVTFIPTIATWFGQYMADVFKQSLEHLGPSPSPSPS
jgi:ssDNA-binding Zn-finger/Zn-ribbon topoisomerase 1